MTLMNNEMPQTQCPNCKEEIDYAMGKDTTLPKRGNLSLCGYCAYISKYDDDMQLIELPSHEVFAVATNDLLMRMHSNALKVIARNSKGEANELPF